MQLTDEQAQTINDLRAEVDALDVEANSVLASLKNGGDINEAFQKVLAIDSEAAMKELIAYIPQKGDAKVGSLAKKIKKLQGKRNLTKSEDMELRVMEARMDTINSINEWRDSLGLPLLDRFPRSVPGSGQECAIARAIKVQFNDFRDINDVSVGATAFVKWVETRQPEEGEHIPCWQDPDSDGNYIFEREIEKEFGDQSFFINRFDDYMMPDLIEDAAMCEAIIYSINAVSECLESFPIRHILEHPSMMNERLRRLNAAIAEYKRRIDSIDLDGSIDKDVFEDRFDHAIGHTAFVDSRVTIDRSTLVASVNLT